MYHVREEDGKCLMREGLWEGRHVSGERGSM